MALCVDRILMMFYSFTFVPGLFDSTVSFLSQVWKPSWPLWSSRWRKWWTSWFWPSSLSLFLPLLAFNCSWEICVKNAFDGPWKWMELRLNSWTPHLPTPCPSTTRWGSMIQYIPTVHSISLNILKTQVCLTYIISLVWSWYCPQRDWFQFLFRFGFR